MKPGTPVTVALDDGSRVSGQVWSLAEPEGYVWLALEGGHWAAAHEVSRVVRNRLGHATRIGILA